ncbi:MAG TPA: hypothetical protein VLC46_16475 [Thermoanaerobaculia bacterium]|nr:hypothetical protein [Thermoanaerobaculia bacterium]
MPSYADFNQAPVAGILTGFSAASLSDAIAPAEGDRYLPSRVIVMVELSGAITNTDITVSIGIADANGVTGWTVPVTQAVRTLPGGAKVVGLFEFSTLCGTQMLVVLESAITGGGTAKLYTAFVGG